MSQQLFRYCKQKLRVYQRASFGKSELTFDFDVLKILQEFPGILEVWRVVESGA